MTVTLTPVSRNQLRKVGNVALWVVVTNGIGVLVAWLSSKPQFLSLGPTLNIIGVYIKQIGTTEETEAIGQLPTEVIQPTEQLLDDSPA